MEDLTPIPMDAHDRERLALLLHGEPDTLFIQELIRRYDIARSVKAALIDRPHRAAFVCDPDESGGLAEIFELQGYSKRVIDSTLALIEEV